ncbi:hypothetical protein PR048_024333 [Dryococelus australis]|uniref:Uncharacterized protein n=1 Tax=Dryococelus australis TaxID=614101 RepID=A0ABQ9GNC1_9NEOP|nr:hypothetical protein PR048_024333 [Dryococelus australis]
MVKASWQLAVQGPHTYQELIIRVLRAVETRLADSRGTDKPRSERVSITSQSAGIDGVFHMPVDNKMVVRSEVIYKNSHGLLYKLNSQLTDGEAMQLAITEDHGCKACSVGIEHWCGCSQTGGPLVAGPHILPPYMDVLVFAATTEAGLVTERLPAAILNGSMTVGHGTIVVCCDSDMQPMALQVEEWQDVYCLSISVIKGIRMRVNSHPNCYHSPRSFNILYAISNEIWGCGGRAVSPLASHQGNRVQCLARSLDFRIWEWCRMMPLVRGVFPFPPTLSLRYCSILTSIPLVGSQDFATYHSPLVYPYLKLSAICSVQTFLNNDQLRQMCSSSTAEYLGCGHMEANPASKVLTLPVYLPHYLIAALATSPGVLEAFEYTLPTHPATDGLRSVHTLPTNKLFLMKGDDCLHCSGRALSRQ